VTGFGQDGPYANRGGYDFLAQGMGGLMSVTGEADGPPLKVGVAMADLATGMYATVSILAALRHAERTGEGQQIDISLLDTQIAMLANQASSYLVGGVVPGRMGNRHPTVVPYTTFEVTDGTVIIAIGNDGQFRAFCTEMGVPELGTDPRFAAASARVVNRDAIEALMRGLVAHETRNGLIARLEAAGVPVGPVNTVEDVFDRRNRRADGPASTVPSRVPRGCAARWGGISCCRSACRRGRRCFPRPAEWRGQPFDQRVHVGIAPGQFVAEILPGPAPIWRAK
jgi:crotonobetainyl-CoA:carnitine CoA-transferase CaiB-like acyl-CoA transferase